jgi:hypothetical protein
VGIFKYDDSVEIANTLKNLHHLSKWIKRSSDPQWDTMSIINGDFPSGKCYILKDVFFPTKNINYIIPIETIPISASIASGLNILWMDR